MRGRKAAEILRTVIELRDTKRQLETLDALVHEAGSQLDQLQALRTDAMDRFGELQMRFEQQLYPESGDVMIVVDREGTARIGTVRG